MSEDGHTATASDLSTEERTIFHMVDGYCMRSLTQEILVNHRENVFICLVASAANSAMFERHGVGEFQGLKETIEHEVSVPACCGVHMSTSSYEENLVSRGANGYRGCEMVSWCRGVTCKIPY